MTIRIDPSLKTKIQKNEPITHRDFRETLRENFPHAWSAILRTASGTTDLKPGIKTLTEIPDDVKAEIQRVVASTSARSELETLYNKSIAIARLTTLGNCLVTGKKFDGFLPRGRGETPKRLTLRDLDDRFPHAFGVIETLKKELSGHRTFVPYKPHNPHEASMQELMKVCSNYWARQVLEDEMGMIIAFRDPGTVAVKPVGKSSPEFDEFVTVRAQLQAWC